MWKNGVGLKHKGKEEKEWKMQNEQNKQRISMIWKYSRIKKETLNASNLKTIQNILVFDKGFSPYTQLLTLSSW